MTTQIQLRRDTAANWTSVNPILADAEFGVELVTYKIKMGDGVRHWVDLDYFVGASGVPGTDGGGGTTSGDSGESLRRDGSNGPVVGELGVNVVGANALHVQSAIYTLGSEISRGDVDVASQDGATISGLTIGQWYAVENRNGPWSPWPPTTPAFYIFAASNTPSGETFKGQMGHVDAIPTDPLRRWQWPIMCTAYPDWASYGEIVNTNYYRFYFKATTTSIRVRGADNWTVGGWLPIGTLGWILYSVTAEFTEALNVDTTTGETTIQKLITPSTDLVTNLNADMLDGKHADEIGGVTLPVPPDPTVFYNGVGEWAIPAGGSGGEGGITINAADDYICIQDQKAQNTYGGAFDSGAWRTRDLNTILADTGSFVSLSSNQITLAAGTYRCHISCPACYVGMHQARLHNMTDDTTLLLGTTAMAWMGVDTMTDSVIVGSFTLTVPKVIEVQHYAKTASSAQGFGYRANIATEVYTVAEFWKVKQEIL